MERHSLRALETGADRDVVESALFEIKRVIAGQDEMLERVFVCLLAGGHLLIEGVPGLAKTLTIKTVADVLGGQLPAGPVHARPRAGRPRRDADVPRAARTASTRARPGLLQLPARRRDQPRARQGAVGAARGDAGAAGHDRQGDPRRAVAVPRDGDAEPDRVRGHVSAARGAGRPLHAQGARRLPGRGGRADRDRARARRPGRRRELLSVEELAELQAATRRVYVDPAVSRYALAIATATRRLADARARGARRLRRRTAPARAGRSTSSSARARSRFCADAATCCRRTSASWPRTCSGTGWCSATRRSPRASTRTRSSTACSRRSRCRSSTSPGRTSHEHGQRTPTGPHTRPSRPRAAPGCAPAQGRPDRAPADRRAARRRPPLVGIGDGTELAQVRPYAPGDDVRLIDWNVTARTGEPHVRVNVAERAVETWLLLDTSASMTFGTADRRKWDVAEGVSLAIGHFAVRRGNRLARRHLRRPQPRRLAGTAGRPRPARAPARTAAGARSRAHRADVARRRARLGSAVSPGGAR